MSSGFEGNAGNSNSSNDDLVSLVKRYGANNYHPIDVVITEAEGIWVTDPTGKRYLDMLSSYSALNQGHRHPRIIQALKNQAERVTLTSRAFHHELLGELYRRLAMLTGKTRFLPMNTGAEAVETAIKAARRWAYTVKKVPDMQADIIICEGNFHGRTVTMTSLSTEHAYRLGFGPFTPGFTVVPYGDTDALERAITPHTAAFLFEPIQGEAGVRIPPAGYLKEVRRLCDKHRILMLADEIQTGLGRTGQRFACDWEQVIPDVYILGKALGGGVYPVSAIAGDDEVMNVFNPGSHGSTFGGNPLACAVAIASLEVLEEEKLADRSRELGAYMLEQLKQLTHPAIREARGKGLLIGLELKEASRSYCECLKEKGLLCKDTHETIIRFAPPLVIQKHEVDWAMERIRAAFQA
jgi:ornithine--oxo-acid transaminase